MKLRIGRLDTEFPCDFIDQEIGAYFDDLSLDDSLAILGRKTADQRDATMQPERTTELGR